MTECWRQPRLWLVRCRPSLSPIGQGLGQNLNDKSLRQSSPNINDPLHPLLPMNEYTRQSGLWLVASRPHTGLLLVQTAAQVQGQPVTTVTAEAAAFV